MGIFDFGTITASDFLGAGNMRERLIPKILIFGQMVPLQLAGILVPLIFIYALQLASARVQLASMHLHQAVSFRNLSDQEKAKGNQKKLMS